MFRKELYLWYRLTLPVSLSHLYPTNSTSLSALWHFCLPSFTTIKSVKEVEVLVLCVCTCRYCFHSSLFLLLKLIPPDFMDDCCCCCCCYKCAFNWTPRMDKSTPLRLSLLFSLFLRILILAATHRTKDIDELVCQETRPKEISYLHLVLRYANKTVLFLLEKLMFRKKVV